MAINLLLVNLWDTDTVFIEGHGRGQMECSMVHRAQLGVFLTNIEFERRMKPPLREALALGERETSNALPKLQIVVILSLIFDHSLLFPLP